MPDVYKWYRVVVSFGCYAVGTDPEDKIVYSAPMGRKFVGQSIDRLKNWIEKKGGEVEELKIDA